ncbi:acyl dehydratase [Pullulanibacillus pueri]|uniref:MaoC-like domain-containing protein n=1 Tax=Pullulanibacillus pueri TaxID=1437324 RepID=A0A8J2ZVZ1_9BACL|nr:MaoC/PaaZ C-terminal domain-containing protein [Pullulanibacillus pueri]MBM7682581.1 acyl dehydratase [Pullulanibacillus pueri]GGH82385.1 hypothetical protein GCM10007096_21690 [Pullulanibacillus pueri]
MNTIRQVRTGELLSEILLAPVSRMDLIKYAGASGDFNPIHTIDSEAKKAGLPKIIAHGMWTMGHISQLFTPYYEEGFVHRFVNRFSGMVFLDDVLTLKAKLVDSQGTDLNFEIEAVKQSGEKVVHGHVIFRLYEH